MTRGEFNRLARNKSLNPKDYYFMPRVSIYRKDNTVGLFSEEFEKGKKLVFFDVKSDITYVLDNEFDYKDESIRKRKIESGSIVYKIPIDHFEVLISDTEYTIDYVNDTTAVIGTSTELETSNNYHLENVMRLAEIIIPTMGYVNIIEIEKAYKDILNIANTVK